jgi:hypothetical protein
MNSMLPDLAAGAPGHRDAVAGRGIGIGRVQIDLAGAAGGQHRMGALKVDATSSRSMSST